MADAAIRAEGLGMSFGSVVALERIDLEVAPGTVFGLLGPNGAGKTTLVRILATLLRPSAGTAAVAGWDVVRYPLSVRRTIGLAGQFAAVDEELTGRENLQMIGRLYRLSRSEANRRADDVLERFELTEAADRRVATYSGGMRRRLDLGASLTGRPPVLLLDEPTTGLDIRSRLELWAIVNEMRRDGTTILLTTQYLEEADHLASQIAVIDRGRVAAEGTPAQLKSAVGADILVVRMGDADAAEKAGAVLSDLAASDPPRVDPVTSEVRLAVARADASVEAFRRLDQLTLPIAGIEVSRPTLDDVFLTLTGHAAEGS